MTAAPAETFVRWSPEHWGALGATTLVCVLFLGIGLCLGETGRRRMCRGLGLFLLLLLVGEYTYRLLSPGEYGPAVDNLPLHFCSLMQVMCFAALWFRRRTACALVYFCVLTASIQALITPTLEAPFPSLPFLLFFLAHGLLLPAALAVPLLRGWRARGWDDVRTVLLGAGYAFCMVPVNLLLDTNYCFTQGSPVLGCLLDVLGPAPWYYLWLMFPAMLLFRLLMLPVHDAAEE